MNKSITKHKFFSLLYTGVYFSGEFIYQITKHLYQEWATGDL